jgi:hypothetical protein
VLLGGAAAGEVCHAPRCADVSRRAFCFNGNIAMHPQPSFNLSSPQSPRNPMRVTKRSGAHEPIDVNKIVRAVTRCSEGIPDVDPMRVALKTIAGLYDGATTRELDELSIRTASSFMNGRSPHTRWRCKAKLHSIKRSKGTRRLANIPPDAALMTPYFASTIFLRLSKPL